MARAAVQLKATSQFVVVACFLACAACGSDNHASPDAPSDQIDASKGPTSCWPSDGTTPTGSAVLGTGSTAFEPMPASLPIEYGTQAGFDLVANVKMSGLVPGDPNNVFDPTNPRTRIRAYFADTNIPLNAHAKCPWTFGYVPTGDGSYELPMGVAVIFDTCWRAGNLIGQQVRVDLELVDENGGFVRASQTVVLAPPTGPYPMDPPAICINTSPIGRPNN